MLASRASPSGGALWRTRRLKKLYRLKECLSAFHFLHCRELMCTSPLRKDGLMVAPWLQHLPRLRVHVVSFVVSRARFVGMGASTNHLHLCGTELVHSRGKPRHYLRVLC